MHTVAILALDGVVVFDLSTPIEVFGRTRLPDGQAAYQVRICAPTEEVDAGTFTLHAPWRLHQQRTMRVDAARDAARDFALVLDAHLAIEQRVAGAPACQVRREAGVRELRQRRHQARQ